MTTAMTTAIVTMMRTAMLFSTLTSIATPMTMVTLTDDDDDEDDDDLIMHARASWAIAKSEADIQKYKDNIEENEIILRDTEIENKQKVIYGGDKHIGIDAIFIKKDWWLNNKEKFNKDLIIGETEVDTYYRRKIYRLADKYLEKSSIFKL
jgi:hypothetical protein